jgi:hypothetical protein
VGHRGLLPDVAGTVAAGPANLVGAGWAAGGVSEVDDELLVEFHPSFLGIDVRFHHQRPLFPDLGVELVVPRGEQGGGPVEPSAIPGELEHLGRAADAVAADGLALAEVAPDPALVDQPRVPRVTDVVHPHVAVEPVREEQVLVVERQEDVRHQSRHGHVPVGMFAVLDVDDLLPLPASVLRLPEPEGVRRERGADVALGLLGVVRHPDLERDEPLLAEGQRLLVFFRLPVPDVDTVTVLAGFDVVQVETRIVGFRRRPLRRQHHPVPGLIPVVVVHLHVAAIDLPVAVDREVVLVELEEAAREFAVSVPEHADDDLPPGNAVNRMRRRGVVLEHLLGFDHLLDFRAAWVGSVDDVDARGALAGDDQVISGQSLGVTRGRTGVPAEVVEFVSLVRHLDGVDQLRVGVGVGVDIHDADEVGAVHVHPDPEPHDEGGLLAFRFGAHRRRRRIPRSLYLVMFVAVYVGRVTGFVRTHAKY